ncbi:MAG: hypothetical protein U0228_38945 [Myxococcaceae bacterium]
MVLGALAAAVLLQLPGDAPRDSFRDSDRFDDNEGRGRGSVPVTPPTWASRTLVGLGAGFLYYGAANTQGTFEVAHGFAFTPSFELRVAASFSVLGVENPSNTMSVGGLGLLALGWFRFIGIGLGATGYWLEPTHEPGLQPVGTIRVRFGERLAQEVSVDTGPLFRSSFFGILSRATWSVSWGAAPHGQVEARPDAWRGWTLGAGVTLTQMLSTGSAGYRSSVREAAGRPFLPMLTLEGAGTLGLSRWLEVQGVLTLAGGVVPADPALAFSVALGGRATVWLTPSWGMGLAADVGVAWHGAPLGGSWFRGIVLLPQVTPSLVVAHVRFGRHRLVLGIGASMMFAERFFTGDEYGVAFFPHARLTWNFSL